MLISGPSSPDETQSSPIGNTYSSPGDTGRRKRGRRSSSTVSATPPPANNGRFATSEATPSPSSTNTRRRGRKASNATPTAATPSSTDDIPPSSEAGDGDDADETPPMYVWGTNISVQDVNAAILRFLRNFRENPSQIEGKYMSVIHSVIELEGDSLEVDAHDVFDYDSDLYSKMVRYPLEVLAIFDIVLMDMVSRINPLFEKHIQARIFNLKSSTSMRNLNPSGEFIAFCHKLSLQLLIIIEIGREN